jgi:uncharacterized protein DUF1206
MTSTSESGRDASDRVKSAGREAGNSRWLTVLARFGIAGEGLLYLLIAYLAAKVAFGEGKRTTDQTGALRLIASEPFGKVLLWVLVVCFLALAGWLFSEAAWGCHQYGDDRTRKRLSSGVKGVVFAALAVTTIRLLVSSTKSSSQKQASTTAKALDLPGGQLLVGAAGVVVVAVGLYMVYKGVTRAFEEDLDTGRMPARNNILRLGTVGYVAKGVVFGLVGIFVILAAATYDPKKSRGLDIALQKLGQQPFGKILLIVVALGLACYGAYCFVEARYRRT